MEMLLRLSWLYYLISNISEGVGCLECFRFAETVVEACNWISSQTGVAVKWAHVDSYTHPPFSAVVFHLPASLCYFDCICCENKPQLYMCRQVATRFRTIAKAWGMWWKLWMMCCFISQHDARIGVLSRPLMRVVIQTSRRWVIAQQW